MTNNTSSFDNGYYRVISEFNVTLTVYCSFYLSNSCSDPGRPMVIFTYKNEDTTAHTVDYFKSVNCGKVDPPDNDTKMTWEACYFFVQSTEEGPTPCDRQPNPQCRIDCPLYKVETIEESVEKLDKEFADMGINPDDYEEGEGAMTITPNKGKLFDPKTFSLPKPRPACKAMMMMFRSDFNVVNYQFKVEDYRRIIIDGADPVDYEVIIPGYVLAVNSDGHLNVDCPCDGIPEIVTPAIGSDTRTLQDCFVWALNGWWMDNGEDKHFPGIDPCWFETIENMRLTTDLDTKIAKPVIYAPAGHSEWMDTFHEQWGMYLIPNTERAGQSVWIIRRKNRHLLGPCFTVVKFDENRWDIAFYDQDADVVHNAIKDGGGFDAMYTQSDPNHLYLCMDLRDIYRTKSLEDAPPFIIEEDVFVSLNNCESRGEEHDWRDEAQEELRGGRWVNYLVCEKCNVQGEQIVKEEGSS